MPDQPILPRLLAALSGLMLLALPLPARAAGLAITDPALRDTVGLLAARCNLTLQGPVTAGDAARLGALLEDESIRENKSVPVDLEFGRAALGHVLCLDSAGGDEFEALALAQVISGYGLVTSVPDGARCIGACAVAFMAGSALSSNSDGGARMPMRVLHIGGTLGFHAPDIPDGPAALDYLAGLTVAFSGIDSYTPTARFHPQLLVEMLTQRDPAHPWLIDTTGKAGLYDIRLAGVPPIETDEATWMRACTNLSLQAKGWQLPTDPDLDSWAWRVNLPEEGYNPEANQPPEPLALADEAGVDEAGAGLAAPFFREALSRHHQCLFYHDPEATPPYAAWFERLSEDSRPELRLFDLWQTLPHYTPLAALRRMARVEPADFASAWGRPPVSQPHADLPPVTSVGPGQSLVISSLRGAGENVAIWFGAEGSARFYPAGEAPLAARYRLEAGTICLSVEGGAERCGGIGPHPEAGQVLTLGDETFAILFRRPGDIGPLPGG